MLQPHKHTHTHADWRLNLNLTAKYFHLRWREVGKVFRKRLPLRHHPVCHSPTADRAELKNLSQINPFC